MIANNYDDLSEWSPVALLEEFDKISRRLQFEEISKVLGNFENSDLIDRLRQNKMMLYREIIEKLRREALKEKDRTEGSKNGDWLRNLVPKEIWVATEETGRTGDSRPLEEILRKLRESVTAELIRT